MKLQEYLHYLHYLHYFTKSIGISEKNTVKIKKFELHYLHYYELYFTCRNTEFSRKSEDNREDKINFTEKYRYI